MKVNKKIIYLVLIGFFAVVIYGLYQESRRQNTDTLSAKLES